MTEKSLVETDKVLQVQESTVGGGSEFLVTRAGVGPEALGETADYLEGTLGARVIGAQYFGPRLTAMERQEAAALLARRPITWLLGEDTASGLSGLHLRAVQRVEVRPLTLEGRVLGYAISGPRALEVVLDGVHAPDTSLPPEPQARATFERLEQALGLAGLDFSHVVRTWLHLDDILSWYDEFNHVRTEFFTQRRVFEGLVPASTGIGGANPAGAALVARLWAVQPRDGEVTAQAVPSPLQCPALQYGSSFSRAVEIALPQTRQLLISGTASISPDGRTEHVGDVRGQIARTCEVVEAILESRGMGWADVTRATAYLRHSRDALLWKKFHMVKMPGLPVVTAHSVICREDLLFELEVDASASR